MAVATYSEMIKGLHTFTYDIDRAVTNNDNGDKKSLYDSDPKSKDEKEQAHEVSTAERPKK